jgi:hypothetical protein
VAVKVNFQLPAQDRNPFLRAIRSFPRSSASRRQVISGPDVDQWERFTQAAALPDAPLGTGFTHEKENSVSLDRQTESDYSSAPDMLGN